MKGTIWVSRNCFPNFALKRPEHILTTLPFLRLGYIATTLEVPALFIVYLRIFDVYDVFRN